MAAVSRETGTGTRKGKGGMRRGAAGAMPRRRGGGFKQAGGLIGTQMGSAAARRGFAQARLHSLWPEIAGEELAALCWPVKLAPARGPAGGILTLGVEGANASVVQMQLPVLRDRVNAALGAGNVGRIQLVHASGPPERADRGHRRHSPVTALADLGAAGSSLSTIGDDDLRAALETLARNVLSRI